MRLSSGAVVLLVLVLALVYLNYRKRSLHAIPEFEAQKDMNQGWRVFN